MLTRKLTKIFACAAFLWIPFAFLHAASDSAKTEPREKKKNISAALSPQNVEKDNRSVRAGAGKRHANRPARPAGARRKPVGLFPPSPVLQELKSELSLSARQVRRIEALYKPSLLPKREKTGSSEKRMAARQRELLQILNPRQKDLLVVRYFESAMEVPRMPGPGETGLRKYPLGKPKARASQKEPRDLAEESKILDTLQSAE